MEEETESEKCILPPPPLSCISRGCFAIELVCMRLTDGGSGNTYLAFFLVRFLRRISGKGLFSFFVLFLLTLFLHPQILSIVFHVVVNGLGNRYPYHIMMEKFALAIDLSWNCAIFFLFYWCDVPLCCKKKLKFKLGILNIFKFPLNCRFYLFNVADVFQNCDEPRCCNRHLSSC